jgi:hypothetical protein
MTAVGAFSFPEGKTGKMKTRDFARHILIGAVIFAILTALAIWLGLGPVVHSMASMGN